jgi:hypothetical protein
MLNTINLDDVQFDGAIYPRQKPSTHLIQDYADALAAGAHFPPHHSGARHASSLRGYPELGLGKTSDLLDS